MLVCCVTFCSASVCFQSKHKGRDVDDRRNNVCETKVAAAELTLSKWQLASWLFQSASCRASSFTRCVLSCFTSTVRKLSGSVDNAQEWWCWHIGIHYSILASSIPRGTPWLIPITNLIYNSLKVNVLSRTYKSVTRRWWRAGWHRACRPAELAGDLRIHKRGGGPTTSLHSPFSPGIKQIHTS